MKTGAESYLEGAQQTLDKIKNQIPSIRQAAALISGAVQAGRTVFSFGASHSFMMTEELVYRSGGFMLVNPIYPHGMNLGVRPLTMTSKLERLDGLGKILFENSPAVAEDILILTSTSGRNTVIIDMALAARERGLRIIGVTSLEYSASVASRHAGGKKLADLCDVVLDNGAPVGDAVAVIPDFPQKVGPVSTVGGCSILNAVIAESVSLLASSGMTPPVFMSANQNGGDEFNKRVLDANRDRIHYM